MKRLTAALSVAWRAVRESARHTRPLPAQQPIMRHSGPPWLRARRPPEQWLSMLPLTAELMTHLSVKASIQAHYAIADLPAQRCLREHGWAVS